MDSLFITTKVFDPSLGGKAIQLAGYDVDGIMLDGVYLVHAVEGQYLHVINRSGKIMELHMENFDHKEGLKLQLLQPLQRVEDRQAITRNVEQRKQRSAKQMKKDNAEVERILQENIEPMKLEEILRRMRQLGYIHWSNNNASGFVKHAIKCGMNITKIKTGVYSYNWGGKD